MPPPYRTPPYLPRYVFLGTFIAGAVTPQLRVGWDINVIQQRTDGLTIVVEIGGGYGANLPSIALSATSFAKMNFLYQYTAIAGLGYRGDRGPLHWGLQVGVGPLLYGAHYLGAPNERNVVVTVEGRAELGYRVDARLAVGLSAGISSPLSLPVTSLAGPFVGGAMVGAFASWR